MTTKSAVLAEPPALHDATLLRIDMHWGDPARAELVFRVRGGVLVRLCVSDLSNLVCPHRNAWGPSVSVNDLRGPFPVEGGAERIEVAMQSGDTIVVDGAGWEWSTVTGSRAHDLEQHYGAHWGAPLRRLRMARGPVHELDAAFEVLVFEPSPDARIYATVCMSATADATPVELHLRARPSVDGDHDALEILTAAAHYHCTGAQLGLGHTVSFGRGWQAGSACTHGLISLPYVDGPDLQWAPGSEQCLWLLPITEAERDFKREQGLDALESRFEASNFDYLDPARASVV